MTINPAVYSKLGYDTVRIFAPISMIASFPLLLTVNAAAPARTVAELVAYAKANPAKANYASSSAAFQLATELFKMKTDAPLEHIAYKSSGEMLTAVVGGEVLAALADAPPVSGHLKAGKIRALAVTSAKRLAEYPDGADHGRGRRARSRGAAVVRAVRSRRHAARNRKEAREGADRNHQAARCTRASDRAIGRPGRRLRAGLCADDLADLARWAAIAKAANIKLDLIARRQPRCSRGAQGRGQCGSRTVGAGAHE
jgi:tripartite-type tricarboxylate transporter receptor subunit TctC